MEVLDLDAALDTIGDAIESLALDPGNQDVALVLHEQFTGLKTGLRACVLAQ